MYGLISTPTRPACRAGFRLPNGNILDLAEAQQAGFFADITLPVSVFEQDNLNSFIVLGQPVWRAVQHQIATQPVPAELLVTEPVTLHLPIHVGDYTDFYAGIYHAQNVGRLFRPTAEPLLPNYRHLPVGYHGRASSIVVTDTPVRRPMGQFLADDKPVFGASQALDFELEIGLIIGRENALGEPVPVADAENYIFGLVLFNDWSARDMQRWEYQPLGPFLGKSFASSMSGWVLPFDALEPFRVAGMPQEPAPLAYLQTDKPGHFDIALTVDLNDSVVSQSNARHLYWSFAQMIAHHTVNGCNLRVGDVLATGTISGPEPGSEGSLLELSRNGTQPLTLSDGTTRTFLTDGDVVTLRSAMLGDVRGKITPALPLTGTV